MATKHTQQTQQPEPAAEEAAPAPAAETLAAPEPADGPRIAEIPLTQLKPSPRNARRTPHGAAAVEALAASIAAKGLLQNLVVTPEQDGRGRPTGAYLVTAGEGRRLALRLLARRRQVPRDLPVRCLVDAAHDPLELSLDENVTRTAMHPADQFEAFRRLGEEQGWGAEEIAARFGVTAQVVRQRLRLAAVSPALVQAYRDGELTLEQLMAFTVSDDHARQEQVYAELGWNREPRTIRRQLLAGHVPPEDRRVRYVGVDAYAAAGGVVVRDLFAAEDGGYCEDAALLDRLALARLEALAAEVRAAEGWRWAEAHLDFPHGHGWRRIWPQPVPLPPELAAQLEALQAEADALVARIEGEGEEEDAAPATEADEARLEALEAELAAIAARRYAYDAETVARAGVVVSLGADGEPRVERGFVRAEDEAAEAEAAGETAVATEASGDTDGDPGTATSSEAEVTTAGSRLSDALVRDLTAHRTLALRLALGGRPDVALLALTHALALQTFGWGDPSGSCLEIRAASAPLTGHADGIEETAPAAALQARHEAWARRLPAEPDALWAAVAALDDAERGELLAQCVARSLAAVQQRGDHRPAALAAADRVAGAVGLAMETHWAPTVASYLGRVPKALVLAAVREGVSDEAADAIAGLKKGPMAEAAERALAGTGWLPPLLRAGAPGDGPEGGAASLPAAA